MKKLLFVIASLLIALISVGQSVVSKKASVDKYIDLKQNETYIMPVNANDIAIADTDSIWTYIIGVDNLYDVNKQYVKVVLDKLTGTPAADVAWQGKYFWDDSWTTITTIHWAGAADTTMLFDQSTGKHYRFYRLNHAGREGTYTYEIDKVEIQFYK